MRPEVTNPVWMLFRRRIFSQMAYWLSVLGYNVRDRSATNRIYLIYFYVFWSVWVVAMFFLLSYTAAGILGAIKVISLLQLSVMLYTYIILAWMIVQLWQVTGRSPFVFSEEDSYLLCQTPVSRRDVGLVRFSQGWLKTFLPFAVIAVVLSFALVESGPQPSLLFPRMIRYFGAGLRTLSIVLPLQMALQAWLWGIGALRLRCKPQPRNQKHFWLRLSAPLLVLLLTLSVLIPGLYSTILSPLSFPIQATFTGSSPWQIWLGGFSLSILYLVTGILALTIFVGNINLSQAAQETKLHAAVQLARTFWSYDLADALIQRQRLGTTHSPTRLPARPGYWMLVWKDALQSLRSLRLSLIKNWALVFGLSLGMLVNSNWAVQLLAGGFWAINLGSLATQRLRNDLARWWLLRSLPIRAVDIFKAEVGLACVSGTLLSWLALVFIGKPFSLFLIAAALMPFLVVNSALATAHDILRKSEARILLSPSIAEENVPRQSVEGAIRTVISVLIPFGILIWFFAHPNQVLVGLACLPVAIFITIINIKGVLAAYRWVM